jgi:hypothetical protein
MQVEGIPDGWYFVRVGKVKLGEFYVNNEGFAREWTTSGESGFANYVVISKIEKPKRYRPFANAAEFEPHRDRWIMRGDRSDTEETTPSGCFRVAAYNDHHFWTTDGRTKDYAEALEDGKKFEDGTPFGVEVVE